MAKVPVLVEVERYERDIIERLRKFEREGKGILNEHCTISVGDRHLPFVSFKTGDNGVLVTARHHVYQFWGTTETVMRLSESGEEGFTLVPVVDIEHFDKAESRKEKILEYELPSLLMWDLFRGYKGNSPTVAENDWDDYDYLGGKSPPHIDAIKTLLKESVIFFDLHNYGAEGYSFVIAPMGCNEERLVHEKMLRDMKDRVVKLEDKTNKINEQVILIGANLKVQFQQLITETRAIAIY